jgi:hypothetical protein
LPGDFHVVTLARGGHNLETLSHERT